MGDPQTGSITEINNDSWQAQLEEAVSLLKSGECVGMPTETVYGLAADALNPRAVARVFETKRRPAFDPLIVHVSPEMDLSEWVKLNPNARRLIDHFWPGPLTLLVEKRSIISDLVTSGHDTVALRCPDHQVAQSLIRAFGGPLVAPSANLFGQLSPTTADAVRGGLGESVRCVLDGGRCAIGLESTIVNTTLPPPRLPLLRFGGVAPESLEALGFELEYPTPIIGQAPGTLKNHYAPRIPLYLWDPIGNEPRSVGKSLNSNDDIDSMIEIPLSQLAWLGWRQGNREFGGSFILSERGDAQEAAYEVFALLRQISDRGFQGIIAEVPPLEGLGRAISDRLKRGASGYARKIAPSKTGVSDRWLIPNSNGSAQ